MNRDQLISTGIAMFKEACDDVKMFRDEDGTRWWSGSTCAGGGAEYWHKMNQDLMTPSAVAFEVGHCMAIQKIKQIRKEAEAQCNEAAAAFYGLAISQG